MTRPWFSACLLTFAACGNSAARTSPQRSEPPGDAAASVSSSGDACDEVSCVLSGVTTACCAKYAKSSRDKEFDAVMSTLAADADRCASGHVDGYLPVAVTVAADGQVADVAKPAAFGTPLDADVLRCVGDAVRTRTFAQRAQPETLTYTFEVHPSSR